MHNLSRAGKPLLVRYDLDGVRQGADQGGTGAARRPTSGATANCCRCAIPRTSSAWAKSMTPLVPTAALAQRSAAAKCWSRTKAACRPARSRRAAWRWRCRWRRSSASSTSRCRPTATPARRWPPTPARAGIETLRLLPGRHAGSQRQRDRAAGRRRLSRQRPDQRLRQDRRRRQGQGRAGSTSRR